MGNLSYLFGMQSIMMIAVINAVFFSLLFLRYCIQLYTHAVNLLIALIVLSVGLLRYGRAVQLYCDTVNEIII